MHGHDYKRNRRDLLKLPPVTNNGTETTVVKIEPECSNKEAHPQRPNDATAVTTRSGRTVNPPIKLGFTQARSIKF